MLDSQDKTDIVCSEVVEPLEKGELCVLENPAEVRARVLEVARDLSVSPANLFQQVAELVHRSSQVDTARKAYTVDWLQRARMSYVRPAATRG